MAFQDRCYYPTSRSAVSPGGKAIICLRLTPLLLPRIFKRRIRVSHCRPVVRREMTVSVSRTRARRRSWHAVLIAHHARRPREACWTVGHVSIHIFRNFVSFMLERPDTGSDCILQHRGFEQCRPIRYPGNRLVRFEDLPRHLYIYPHTISRIHPQPSQHDSYQSSRPNARDEIEIVAWFGHFVRFGRLAVVAFRVGLVHKVMKEDEHGVAAHTSAIFARIRVSSWQGAGLVVRSA